MPTQVRRLEVIKEKYKVWISIGTLEYNEWLNSSARTSYRRLMAVERSGVLQQKRVGDACTENITKDTSDRCRLWITTIVLRDSPIVMEKRLYTDSDRRRQDERSFRRNQIIDYNALCCNKKSSSVLFSCFCLEVIGQYATAQHENPQKF